MVGDSAGMRIGVGMSVTRSGFVATPRPGYPAWRPTGRGTAGLSAKHAANARRVGPADTLALPRAAV
jgi:hypothetical protein